MSKTSVSGLDQVAGSAMLHQPHQARSVDAPGDRFALVVPFESTVNFGRNNRVFLPPLEIVPEDIYVEFTMNAIPLADATPLPANLNFPNVQSWIGEGGVQLLYKSQSIYTMSEAEAMVHAYVNNENQMQLTRRLDIVNDTNDQAAFRNAVPGNELYYMSLRPIAEKINGNAGPLTAYAANSWSFDIRLRQLHHVLQASTNLTAVSTAIPIRQARLIIIGHREDAANAMRVSEALAKDGVKVCFNQANHLRDLYTGLVAPISNRVITLSDLEGEATDIWLVHRNHDPAANFVNQAIARNPQSFVEFNGPDSLLSIGTSSNPTRVYGQPLAVETIRKLMPGVAYEGATVLGKFNDDSTFARVDSGIVFISLAEAGSMGQKFGTYSGSIRLKNDFRVTYVYNAPRTQLITDVIVFIRRVLVLTHAGIIMVNEE